ncbi:unnamed protein product [Cuscuta europaea]|uniref:Uncharacterized protein n=1 Tax=Cuscuta europaea TaxID=41803 RepID=A0A9P0ZCP0_CUSEU|nr:unnamed protein product [Cuscuta europaea]
MDMDHRLKRLPDSSSLNIYEPENQQSLDIPDINNNAPPIAQCLTKLGTCSGTLDSGPVHKHLTQYLLEEESIIDGNNPDMYFDPIALIAVERSYYEALHHYHSSTFHSNAGSSKYDVGKFRSSEASSHPDIPIQSSLSQTNSDRLNIDDFLSANSVPKIVCNDDTESILQLKRDVDDAGRFLNDDKQVVINLDNYLVSPSEELNGDAVTKIEKGHSADLCRGKKHYHLDKSGLEEENRIKHSAVYHEEVELAEVFDNILLCTDDDYYPSKGSTQQENRNGYKSQIKKRRYTCETVDLESFLISCAQSVVVADYRAAEDELKKIRQHSLPTGNANQRMAHAFADGLEARLAGTGTQLYVALSHEHNMIAEMLKSYMSSWPFMRVSIFFSNGMIYEVASKCESLHVIDFGINYGIQWPTLIRDISQRPGGPPKLRITGIEFPQPGFRPSQMVEETGRRLAKYCERFGVPFEYNAITTSNWERIKIDELKLVGSEVIAVNCIVKFQHLLDETAVGADNPRGAVLNLIREANPHIYMQTVSSGSQNSPFFISRFREAVFYYTAVFDTLDATLPHNDNQRLNLEKEVVGCEIMNIVACEGKERFQRPETCKQWHSRIMRAINPTLAKKLRRKARKGYHKDFLFL